MYAPERGAVNTPLTWLYPMPVLRNTLSNMTFVPVKLCVNPTEKATSSDCPVLSEKKE